MKAEITENGMLVVTPENPTESFALSCWWDKYQKPTDKPTGLKVNLSEPIRFDEGSIMRTGFSGGPTTPKPQIIPKGQSHKNQENS